MPRIVPVTGYGILTDIRFKRKVCNFVERVKGASKGYGIHIKEGTLLDQNHEEAYKSVKVLEPSKKADAAGFERLVNGFAKTSSPFGHLTR